MGTKRMKIGTSAWLKKQVLRMSSILCVIRRPQRGQQACVMELFPSCCPPLELQKSGLAAPPWGNPTQPAWDTQIRDLGAQI